MLVLFFNLHFWTREIYIQKRFYGNLKERQTYLKLSSSHAYQKFFYQGLVRIQQLEWELSNYSKLIKAFKITFHGFI